jgi:hypothetical protein
VICHLGVINAYTAQVLGLSVPFFFEPNYTSLFRTELHIDHQGAGQPVRPPEPAQRQRNTSLAVSGLRLGEPASTPANQGIANDVKIVTTAASSTNTSGPRRSQGQDQWPSSGTPQAGSHRITTLLPAARLPSCTAGPVPYFVRAGDRLELIYRA